MILLALPLHVNGPLDAFITPSPDPIVSTYGLQNYPPPMTGIPPPPPPQGMPVPPRRPQWRDGQLVLQGFFGVNEYENFERTGGGTPNVDGSDEDASELPVLGGGGQWKLAGRNIDFGMELMFSFAWRANATAFAVGGGGAAIAVDVDTFTTELYGGPFANIFLGDKARVYASVGPLLQWASYDQESALDVIDDSGSGFGTGYYARTGIEFAMGRGTMIGLGVRWSESEVDLGSAGDLEFDGIQWALTVTSGF
jgi:hypothetical protein